MDIDLNVAADQHMEDENDNLSHTNAMVQVTNEGMICIHGYSCMHAK